MTKTKGNAYGYVEQYPDPTAKSAIDHISNAENKKRKVNSRQKGARGEREFAAICREHGYDCRRGQQYCGSNGDADVVGLPGVHLEIKRVEHLNLYDAMAQAKRDARAGERPVVVHRRNNCEWLVTMPVDAWFELFREWEASECNYEKLGG